MHFLHSHVLTTNYKGSLTSDKVSKLLMRCKSPLDSLLCRLDKHFLHSYDSYDSTLHELHGVHDKRQNFQVPLMGCKSPLDSLVYQVDKHFLHSYYSYDSTTN